MSQALASVLLFCSAAHHGTALHSTTWHGSAWHSAAQRSAAQHSMARHGMAAGFLCSEASRTLYSMQNTSRMKAEGRARVVPYVKDMTPLFPQSPALRWAVLCPNSNAAASTRLAMGLRLLTSETTCQTRSYTSELRQIIMGHALISKLHNRSALIIIAGEVVESECLGAHSYVLFFSCN